MWRWLRIVWMMICGSAAFPFLSGRYKVLHPTKKMIRFTEENNEIIETHIVKLKLHPKERMFYHMRRINNTTLSLENICNATDLMILQSK